jgi:hypothetical protein
VSVLTFIEDSYLKPFSLARAVTREIIPHTKGIYAATLMPLRLIAESFVRLTGSLYYSPSLERKRSFPAPPADFSGHLHKLAHSYIMGIPLIAARTEPI